MIRFVNPDNEYYKPREVSHGEQNSLPALKLEVKNSSFVDVGTSKIYSQGALAASVTVCWHICASFMPITKMNC